LFLANRFKIFSGISNFLSDNGQNGIQKKQVLPNAYGCHKRLIPGNFGLSSMRTKPINASQEAVFIQLIALATSFAVTKPMPLV